MKIVRFSIGLEKCVNMDFFSLSNSIGREIFFPKISSFKVIDISKAIATYGKLKFIGIRPREKNYEELITIAESANVIESKSYYLIYSSFDKSIFNTLKL